MSARCRCVNRSTGQPLGIVHNEQTGSIEGALGAWGFGALGFGGFRDALEGWDGPAPEAAPKRVGALADGIGKGGTRRNGVFHHSRARARKDLHVATRSPCVRLIAKIARDESDPATPPNACPSGTRPAFLAWSPLRRSRRGVQHESLLASGGTDIARAEMKTALDFSKAEKAPCTRPFRRVGVPLSGWPDGCAIDTGC